MRANVLVVLAAAVLVSASAAAQTTALTHATVIDGTGAAPQRDVTIVMENGRIRAMAPGLAAPADATVVDLTGKFVVPGIINGHGHVGPPPRDPQLRQYALYGVTTTTSMYFDQDDVQQFKQRQKAGDLSGARILTVMYRFMSEPFKPGSEAKTPEEARAKVDEIVAKGTDFVKVWIDAQGGRHPKLTPEFTAAVMDQARKHGKIRMAHIVELADARRIVDQGVNILVHNVRDQEIPDDFIATLKERNVSVISTLAREEALFVFGDGPGLHRQSVLPEGTDAGAAGAAQDQEARRSRRTIRPARAGCACSTPTRRTSRSSPTPASASGSAPIPAARSTATSSRASSSTARWS